MSHPFFAYYGISRHLIGTANVPIEWFIYFSEDEPLSGTFFIDTLAYRETYCSDPSKIICLPNSEVDDYRN